MWPVTLVSISACDVRAQNPLLIGSCSTGVGKTSLIKALVQSCEHIVHIDPIASHSNALISQSSGTRRGRSKSSRNQTRTTEISEIFASTRPYPEWWSDLDDFQLLKRRKSVDDTILDRNICFIDTPGYSDGASVSGTTLPPRRRGSSRSLKISKKKRGKGHANLDQSMESITPVIRYVESHFEKVQSNTSPDAEMLNMLGGDGGSQVDLVFYLIQKSELFSKLHPKTLANVMQSSNRPTLNTCNS